MADLSDDCWHRVLLEVDVKTLLSFGSVCRRFRDISSAWFIWRHHYLRTWGTAFWRGDNPRKILFKDNGLFDKFSDWYTRHCRPDVYKSRGPLPYTPQTLAPDHPVVPFMSDLAPPITLPPNSGQLDWRALFLQNARMLQEWRSGGDKKVRVLVTGPRGSGKTSFIRAVQQFAKAKDSPAHTAADLEALSLSDSVQNPFDPAMVVTTKHGETEVSWCEVERAFQWLEYRGGEVKVLIHCVDQKQFGGEYDEEERMRLYDHFHGMLGEAYQKKIIVFGLVTKVDQCQPSSEIRLALERTNAVLRIKQLYECGWYRHCYSKIFPFSCSEPKHAENLTKELNVALDRMGWD